MTYDPLQGSSAVSEELSLFLFAANRLDQVARMVSLQAQNGFRGKKWG
jgi:hypothetical protein